MGYQVESFSKHNLSFTVLDMSGESRYRNLWEVYYSDVQAVIYVIDSTDKVRLCVARDEVRRRRGERGKEGRGGRGRAAKAPSLWILSRFHLTRSHTIFSLLPLPSLPPSYQPPTNTSSTSS